MCARAHIAEETTDTLYAIAENLRRLRGEKRLSLDDVARFTGVSKSMLGQIERRASNPTIQTVWRIANGLRISLSGLLRLPENETEIVRTAEISPVVGDSGRFRVYSLFPFHEETRFEILSVEMDEGAFSASEAHTPGTLEYLLATEGRTAVRLGEEERILAAGDSLRYRADRPHAYRNAGPGRAGFRMVMFYPE